MIEQRMKELEISKEQLAKLTKLSPDEINQIILGNFDEYKTSKLLGMISR